MMNTPTPFSSTKTKVLGVAFGVLAGACMASAGSLIPELEWKSHDRECPTPEVVIPGKVSTDKQVGTAPSDAVVLFDGSSLEAWVDSAGEPTKWVINDGALECVPSSGYVRTLQSFGDCQLHIEWATPSEVKGDGQGRGNSGVFFAFGKYEVQVLDSYQNLTYSDGSASSIYGQYPPLVNVTKAPGEWQTYDILYTAPRFEACGKLKSPARITVLHNGVVTQNNVKLTGPTAWIGRPAYGAHQEKMPLALQDHGNPVRYRNIWVRELGEKDKPEFYLAESTLDKYAGEYKRGKDSTFTIKRLGNGLLGASLAGADLVLYAESKTQFFDKTTDVLFDFSDLDKTGDVKISVGSGWMKAKKL